MAFIVVAGFVALWSAQAASPAGVSAAADDSTLTVVKECVADYDGVFAIHVKGSGADSGFNQTVYLECGDKEDLTVDSGVEYTVSEPDADDYEVSIRGACDGDGTVTFPFQGKYEGTCTVRNEATSVPSTLTVMKECAASYQGTFTINVSGGSVDEDLELACGGSDSLTVSSGVEYTVSEVDADGYETSIRGACDGDGTVTFPFQGKYEGTCVVSNTATTVPSTLTVTKECAASYQGTFTINVSGGSVDEDLELACGGSDSLTVSSGVEYTVSEVDADGYETSIRGACDGDGTVTFPFQGKYEGTCVVSNTATTVPSTLTVTKECAASYQGTFTINVAGGSVDEDLELACGGSDSLTVSSGIEYTVSEVDANGYNVSIRGACDGDGTVTFPFQGKYEGTCVVSNSATTTPATLTLTKECVGDYDGPFTINVNGGSVDEDVALVCGQSDSITVSSGTKYTVSEVDSDGYNVSIRGACDGDGTVTFPFQGKYEGTCVVRNEATMVSANLTLLAECESGYRGGFTFNVYGPNVNQDVELECDESKVVEVQGNTQYTVSYGSGTPVTLMSRGGWEPEFEVSFRGACDGDGTVTLGADDNYEGTCVAHIELVNGCDLEPTARGGDWNNNWCKPDCDNYGPTARGGDWDDCKPDCDYGQMSARGGNWDDDCKDDCGWMNDYQRGGRDDCHHHDDCDKDWWDKNSRSSNQSDWNDWKDKHGCRDDNHDNCDKDWWDNSHRSSNDHDWNDWKDKHGCRDNVSDNCDKGWWDKHHTRVSDKDSDWNDWKDKHDCDDDDDRVKDRDKDKDKDDKDKDDAKAEEDCDCNEQNNTVIVNQTTLPTTSQVQAAPVITTTSSGGTQTQQISPSSTTIRPPSSGDAGMLSESRGSGHLALYGLVAGGIAVTGIFLTRKLAR